MHFIERMLFYVSSHQEKVKIYLVGDHSDRCGISARANHALLFSALTQAGHMAHTVADFPHSTATSKNVILQSANTCIEIRVYLYIYVILYE